MRRLTYDQLIGIDTLNTSTVAPQVSFRKLNNFIVKRERHALKKRGGSQSYDVTGDLWGIGGYAKTGTSDRNPVKDVPVRHRRVSSTSYIEKLNLSTNAWTTITQGANTSFDIGNIAAFAQLKDFFCMAAGRPAKITDIDSGDIERIGGSAPAAPSTALSAGGLTGTYRHVITFVDESTGWESSPSPATSAVAASSQQIDLSSIPASGDREGITHVYIYRTINTNEEPFRYSGKVTIGTTTYSDNVADASLGTDVAPISGDHDEAPDDCYVCAIHKNRLWLAVNNVLWYSRPDDGTGVPLEYFSLDRREFLPQRITGLIPNISGGLYIFQPPSFGIHEVVGEFEDEDDFKISVRFPREGTYFHKSVAAGGQRGEIVAFWGQRGPRFIAGGQLLEESTRDVTNICEDNLKDEYDSDAFAWTVYDHANAQFIMCITMLDGVGTGWENVQTGADVQWINVDTGLPVDWELQ